MKKILSYREKLIELAQIYKIAEVQNYIKRKKTLTTSQLEHILKKNNVPIPKDFNVGFFEKNISKPINKAGKGLTGFYDDTTGGISKLTKKTSRGVTGIYDDTTGGIKRFFLGSWRAICNLSFGILNTFPKLVSTFTDLIGKIFYESFSIFHNPNIKEKSANKLVSVIGIFIIISGIGIMGYTIFDTISQTSVDSQNVKAKLETKSEKFVKKDKPKDPIKPKKGLIEKKKTDQAKKSIRPKKPEQKEPSTVTELVLPNLNLKTQTVLNLFEDVEYDLKTVRYQKKVKPIYFTQFPKDLDEIKNVQLKKETFIKIVLPLVVAENEKILDDRIKLQKILSKKMTTDKEKSWLRLKLREYKVKKSDFKELSKRMDIIPVSIALAQAAKESGWGTSRFALEGNAIFGQWTWTGKGIEPLLKGKHQDHKILRFPILRASVKAYKNNLNTHKGYSDFREKRFSLRKRNKNIKGLALTGTLDKYAQTGKEYTEILEQIIKQNRLNDFERVQLTNSIVKQELNL